MIFNETKIPGAYVIELEPISDDRGSFARTWCQVEFENHGLSAQLVQCSTSLNLQTGTLRGLHYQRAPHLEAKLVRCTRGSAFDVIVDMRESSPMFGQWCATEISADNGRMIYIPEGVAHGFQTLENETEIFYQISTHYAPEFAAGVRWDDPDIAIDWPKTGQRIISERDCAHPMLRDITPAKAAAQNAS